MSHSALHALMLAAISALTQLQGGIAISYKKGDVSVHRRTTTFSTATPDHQGDLRLVFRATEQAEIKDVNAKGEATIVTTCFSMEIMHGDHNDQPEKIETTRFPPTTRVFASNGLLIREIEPADEERDALLVVEGLIANNPLPTESMAVGGSWRTELQNQLVPGRRVTMISRYLGQESVFGIPTMKTAFSMDVPTSPAGALADTISVTGERFLDTTTGRLARSRIEIRNAAFSARGSRVRGTVQILDERIVPTDNGKPAGNTGSDKK